MRPMMTKKELQNLSASALIDLVVDLQERLLHRQDSDSFVPPALPASDMSRTSLNGHTASDSTSSTQPEQPDLPDGYQKALSDQTRRAALLTQVAIELNDVLEVDAIVDRVLRVTAATMGVTYVSIVLVHPNGLVELARHVEQGQIVSMNPELASDVLERGLTGWVMRYDQSVLLSDVANNRHWQSLMRDYKIGSAIAVPIKKNHTTRGVLTVTNEQSYQFTSHDLLLLEGIVAQVSVALNATRQRLSETRWREHAFTLLTTSQYLTAERSFEELATMLQDKSVSVFDVDYGLLYLSNYPGSIEAVALPGTFQQESQVRLRETATTAARQAWQHGQPVMPGNITDTPASLIALPLVHNGTTIGAIVLLRSSGERITFSANTWSLLTVFSSIIASTSANMKLVAQLRDYTEALEELVAQRTRQVQHSRDTLRIIFDNMTEGMLLLDPNKRLLAANNAFCEQFMGQHPRDVVGHDYADIWEQICLRPDIVVSTPRSSASAQSSHHTRLVQITGAQQGQYEVTRSPIYDEHHELVQYLEIWHPLDRPANREQPS